MIVTAYLPVPTTYSAAPRVKVYWDHGAITTDASVPPLLSSAAATMLPLNMMECLRLVSFFLRLDPIIDINAHI
jgi:hypothetical protein